MKNMDSEELKTWLKGLSTITAALAAFNGVGEEAAPEAEYVVSQVLAMIASAPIISM